MAHDSLKEYNTLETPAMGGWYERAPLSQTVKRLSGSNLLTVDPFLLLALLAAVPQLSILPALAVVLLPPSETWVDRYHSLAAP